MKQPSFLIALGVMFLVGAFDMTRSISGPLIQRAFSLSYEQLGVLFSSVSIGYLIGSLSCGWIVDHVGIKKSVLTGGMATIAGFLLTATGGTFWMALLGFGLSGLGSGWMEVGVNAIIPMIAAKASERNAGESNGKQSTASDSTQAGMFNILHGLYGLGAFVFPIAGTWLITALAGWRPLYDIISAALTLLLLAATVTRFPTAKVEEDAGHSGSSAAKRSNSGKPSSTRLPWSRALVGLLLAITTYVMAEAAVGAWMPTYLTHVRHFSLFQSSIYLSGFYLTFTVGRLLGHLWVNRLGHQKSVLWSSAIACILVMVGELNASLTVVLIVAGFGFAVIFPTITAMATEAFPNHSSRVLGLLFTSGGVGSMIMNWLIGAVASWLGLTISFMLIPVCLIATIGGVSLALFKRPSAHESSIVRSL